jgi:hypothetical protein
MVTINDVVLLPSDIENSNYKYQKNLTTKLDNLDSDFNQEIINEIVLWKTNRYSAIDDETLALINKIKKDDTSINEKLTDEILSKLLSKGQKGTRLVMASTILRFKNPKVYQIIDQRVYRFIYGEELSYSSKSIEGQIAIYLRYLEKLRDVSNEYNFDFDQADRILYTLDKKHNSEEKLKGY